MRKILLLATLAIFVLGNVNAQRTADDSNPELIFGKFKENWFIDLGFGGEMYVTGSAPRIPTITEFNLNAAPMIRLSAGKYFNHYLALRMKFDQAFVKGESDFGRNAFVALGSNDFSMSTTSVHGDLMLNLSSILGGYKGDRFYEIIPFIGAGVIMAYNSEKSVIFENYTGLGLYNDFRINNSLSAFLEIQAVATRGNAHGEAKGTGPNIYPFSATVGVRYNISPKEANKGQSELVTEDYRVNYFRSVEQSDAYNNCIAESAPIKKQLIECETQKGVSEEEMTTLETELETLKAREEAHEKEIERIKRNIEQIEVQRVEERKLLIVRLDSVNVGDNKIFFNINSSKLKPIDILKLENIAKVINDNTHLQFVIEGYADSQTGKIAHNRRLTLRRAEAVRKILVDTYGVNSDQIEIAGKGGVSYLSDKPEGNRTIQILVKD